MEENVKNYGEFSTMEQDPLFKKFNNDRKKTLIELRNACIDSESAFAKAFDRVGNFTVEISKDEKLKNAFDFLFGELLDIVELGYESWGAVMNIAKLKASGEDIKMGVRELKMMNEFVKSLKLKGVEIIVKAGESIESFGPSLRKLYELEVEQRRFAEEMQKTNANYVKTCQKYNLRADNTSDMFERMLEKQKQEKQSNTTGEKPAKKSKKTE